VRRGTSGDLGGPRGTWPKFSTPVAHVTVLCDGARSKRHCSHCSHAQVGAHHKKDSHWVRLWYGWRRGSPRFAADDGVAAGSTGRAPVPLIASGWHSPALYRASMWLSTGCCDNVGYNGQETYCPQAGAHLCLRCCIGRTALRSLLLLLSQLWYRSSGIASFSNGSVRIRALCVGYNSKGRASPG
jgi:hypothetical protein